MSGFAWKLVFPESSDQIGYLATVTSSGLPDEQGRVQILEIHTAKMREHKLLAPDVDLADLAVQTKNFTGAEIEGLVRAAQSTAMNRFIQVMYKENARRLRLFVFFQDRYKSAAWRQFRLPFHLMRASIVL